MKVVSKREISVIELLLCIGIITFLVFPLFKIFNIKTLPYFDTINPSEISNIANNIIALALAKPIPDGVLEQTFKPVKGYENINLEASVKFIPHFVFDDITIVRVSLRWGLPIFKKSITLETVINKSHL